MLTDVKISIHPIERFRGLLGERYEEVGRAAREALEVFAGRVIWHVSSTASGGGVAEMLRSQLAYVRAVGIDTRWMVAGDGDEFFRLTKRIHNNLHGFAGDGGEVGEPERAIYEAGLETAASDLAQLVRAGDLVFLHDPQPAGLVRALRVLGAQVLWRCHVGVDSPNELTRRAWDFLRPYVTEADAYAFSRRQYVWDGLDEDKVWIVPPSIDPFAPKNEKLSDAAAEAILRVIGVRAPGGGGTPVFRRFDGSPARADRPGVLDQDQPIPASAPIVAQVSRWDRLKDPVGVLDCFDEHLDVKEAHLVLAGPDVASVADDPEGREVLAEVCERRAALHPETRARVHLVSLPMADWEENAAMVNALQRRADVIVQKSLAEGFGLTVAEAMWKERPVVAGRVGGMQDQIVDGESGILIDDPRDLAGFGRAISGLLSDPARAARIGVWAHERVKAGFLVTNRLVAYLELFSALIDGRPHRETTAVEAG